MKIRSTAGNRNTAVRPRSTSWRSGFRTTSAVYGYGIRIFVDRGRLIIADGFANEGERRRTVLSRGTCRLQRLVVLGRTGVITLDALQWLVDMGVAVLFINPDGGLNSTHIPGGLEGSKVRLHRVQATARDTEVGHRIARMLIIKKLRGQLEILNWLTDPGRQSRVDERERIDRMRSAAELLQRLAGDLVLENEIEEIVEAERIGAEAYWRALAGLPLPWSPRALKRLPEHWLVTQPRESYRTGNRYGATDPGNALLNYGYALLEAETRIACLTAGLHPGLGIFHADSDGRASFIYDLMEPSRPQVDRLVLRHIQRHRFTDGDFLETREGHCRLDPNVAAGLISWTSELRSTVRPVLHQVTKWLRQWEPQKFHSRLPDQPKFER